MALQIRKKTNWRIYEVNKYLKEIQHEAEPDIFVFKKVEARFETKKQVHTRLAYDR